MFVIKLGQAYMVSFNNTYCEATLTSDVRYAKSFLTRDVAELWAKQWLTAYSWEIIEYKPEV